MTRVFVASNMATDYPYKLQKPSTINDKVRATATDFIMDSGIGDEVSNQKVLDLATEHSADWVVAKDYLHDHDKTTTSIVEFLDAYEASECTATPMIPLQPPHDEHYLQLQEEGIEAEYFVLGGMATEDVSTRQAINWIEAFDRVSNGEYVHGLGVGGGIEFVSQMAGRGILDSIDCSTPEQAAMFGKVLDERLRQQSMRVFESGEGAQKRNKALAELNSWQLQDVWDRETNNADGLAAFA